MPIEGLCKPMFCESREIRAESMLAGYSKASQTERGAFLLTVMRGKFSEGIDFKDNMCRAMVIVGVPFPPQSVEIHDKQRYIDASENKVMDSREWYVVQGMKAVNQAIGRVVRHPGDYGGIFLVDKRYSSRQQLKSCLPGWFERVDIGEFNLLAYRAFFQNRSGEEPQKKMEIEVEQPLKKKKRLLLMQDPEQ
jgi:Rad3-related DNA helicase